MPAARVFRGTAALRWPDARCVDGPSGWALAMGSSDGLRGSDWPCAEGTDNSPAMTSPAALIMHSPPSNPQFFLIMIRRAVSR